MSVTTRSIVAAAAVTLCGALLYVGAASVSSQEIAKAQFAADGQVMRPVDWRSWIYVGTPLTPNALNGGKAPFPEFHNVYVEPGAFASFSQTGKWPEGTQIAKELVLIRKGDDCETSNGACTEVSGVGYFQGEFQGLELAVKDTSRFPKEPGGWSYFSFGHQPEPYAKTAAAFPPSRAMHVTKQAPKRISYSLSSILCCAPQLRRIEERRHAKN